MPISRPTITDDSGNGTSGTAFNAAFWSDIFDRIDVGFPATGTFTPTITSSGGGTPTYTTQIGRYSKSGSRFHADIYVKLATAGTLAAGTLKIAGLPQTVKNTSNYFPAVTVSYWENLTTAAVFLGGFMSPNTTTITLHHTGTAGATTTAALTLAQASGTFGIILHVSYEVE